MKITTSQNELNNNLSFVSRAVPSRPTHPILGNVLLVADGEKGEISLTAFDLSLGIRTSFRADVSEGGKITLPAKLLNDIVTKIVEGEIVIDVSGEAEDGEHSLVSLRTASGQFQIRGLKADEFPELPTVAGGETIGLPTDNLIEGLKGALFAASTDETKQVLTGVHLTKTVDSLEFAATDGHRLSVVRTPLEDAGSSSKGFSVTIPARALRELERMLAARANTETIVLHVDEAQVVFELDEQRLTSRKLEGAYPAYGQLIPKSFSRNLTLDRKQLIRCLELVAVLTDGKNNLVKFGIDGENDRLFLSVESPDLGSARESMAAEIEGDSGDIAFNVKYLMDGLKALPGNDIQMQLNANTQPVIFTPLSALKMTYLVMPVQIRQ